MLGPVGLLPPMTTHIPAMPVRLAGLVNGAGVAVLQPPQVNDRYLPLPLGQVPAGSAGAGDPSRCRSARSTSSFRRCRQSTSSKGARGKHLRLCGVAYDAGHGGRLVMAGERSSTSTSTVQMTTARYAGDRSREVDAAMIEHHRDEWPQLACVTERCDCLVHAVHKAPTETTAGRSAHFARNATSVHADCCHLGTTRQVEILEKMSGGELKAVGKHRDPLRGDVFLHRIPVPAAFDETPEQRPGQPPEVTPLTFARQIVPILNTAVKIAKLYQRYSDSDVDPHMKFQAECSGQPVEWPNFFYTRNRAIWFARRIRTAQKCSYQVGSEHVACAAQGFASDASGCGNVSHRPRPCREPVREG